VHHEYLEALGDYSRRRSATWAADNEGGAEPGVFDSGKHASAVGGGTIGPGGKERGIDVGALLRVFEAFPGTIRVNRRRRCRMSKYLDRVLALVSRNWW
jgi:hypothetical protein